MTYPETLRHYPTLYTIIKFINCDPITRTLFPKETKRIQDPVLPAFDNPGMFTK